MSAVGAVSHWRAVFLLDLLLIAVRKATQSHKLSVMHTTLQVLRPEPLKSGMHGMEMDLLNAVANSCVDVHMNSVEISTKLK